MIVTIWRNLWRLSACKKSTSTFPFSLRYCKDYDYDLTKALGIHTGRIKKNFSLARIRNFFFTQERGNSSIILFGLMSRNLCWSLVAYKLIGNWLEAGGWTTVISQANISSVGATESFLKGSHIARTRLY